MSLGQVPTVALRCDVVNFLDAKFSFLPTLALKFREATQGQPGGTRAKLENATKLLLVVGAHDLPEAIQSQRLDIIAETSRL